MNNDCYMDLIKWIKIYPLFNDDYYASPKIYIGFYKGIWTKTEKHGCVHQIKLFNLSKEVENE